MPKKQLDYDSFEDDDGSDGDDFMSGMTLKSEEGRHTNQVDGKHCRQIRVPKMTKQSDT